MAPKPLPDQALLLKLLRYDPETGKLFWLPRSPECFEGSANKTKQAIAWNDRYAGKEAFTYVHGGYHCGYFCRKNYNAHRLIWKMMTGETPPQIDHINGIRGDNRFCNLRATTEVENSRNRALTRRNKSGCLGVGWRAEHRKWRAEIIVGSKTFHLGLFQHKADAIRARKAAERRYGFHPNHGRRAQP